MVALALLSCLALSEPYDFEGLKMQALAPPGPSKQRGSSKIWEGRREIEMSGKKQNIAMYSVVVTTAAGGIAQALSEDLVLDAHERTARANKLLKSPNLRTTIATFGPHKLLVLNGSVVSSNASGKPVPAYWVSFAFVRGNRAYEFNMISALETDYKDVLTFVESMQITSGTKLIKPTDYRADLSGEYRIEGVPFQLTSALTPLANPDAPIDASFEYQYDATMRQTGGPDFYYRVRKVKPADERTESELLKALAAGLIPDEVSRDAFTIKDGATTTDFGFKENAKEWSGTLRFERNGPWVALLTGAMLKTGTASLKGFGLRRLTP